MGKPFKMDFSQIPTWLIVLFISILNMLVGYFTSRIGLIDKLHKLELKLSKLEGEYSSQAQILKKLDDAITQMLPVFYKKNNSDD